MLVAFRRRCNAAISPRIDTRSSASRFDSGSSKRKIFGSRTIERPMATRWRWPPESCVGFLCSSWSRRSSLAASPTRFSTSAFEVPMFSSPKAMFWRTVMCGYSAYDWNTIASSRSAARRSLTRWPSIRMSPLVASSRPQMMRSSVLLPQPEGPTKTQNSPSRTSRSTPGITVTVSKRLTTCLSCSDAMSISLRPRQCPG